MGVIQTVPAHVSTLFEAKWLGVGLLLTLSEGLLRESPAMLPLPVEFVAGGEGSPELVEEREAALGLGCDCK